MGTLLHPELEALTIEELRAAAVAIFGAPRSFYVELDEQTCRFTIALELEVVATAELAERGRSFVAPVGTDAEVGEVLCFVLPCYDTSPDDVRRLAHPYLSDEELLWHLGKPVSKFLPSLWEAFARAAEAFVPSQPGRARIGQWLVLPDGGIARGELIVHPPGARSVERAALVVEVEMGGVELSARRSGRVSFRATATSFGKAVPTETMSVQLPQSGVRLAIPLRDVPTLEDLPSSDRAEGFLMRWPEALREAPEDPWIENAAIASAVEEMTRRGPGDAMLHVMSRFRRLGRRRRQCGFVKYRVLVRLNVLLIYSLAFSAKRHPDDIERELERGDAELGGRRP